MDTGAYLNYISSAVISKYNLHDQVTPPNGEKVQLGGTDNFKDITGKIRLTTVIDGISARIQYNVFDTERFCIIGLESLLLHFMDALQGRLSQLSDKLKHPDCGETRPSLFLSTHVYPKEPGGREVDLESLRTTLVKGDQILIANGTVEEAPEEIGSEDQYKQLFSIPRTSREKYLDTTEKMINPALKADKSPEVVRHIAEAMTFLQSEECIPAYVYDIWTGIKISPVRIDLVPGAPTHMHARVRPINKMLEGPAENSINNFVRDRYLVKDNDCPFSSPIVVVPKPRQPEEPRICGDYAAINHYVRHKPIALVDPKKLLDRFRKYKWFIETDWLKSFHQVPIDIQTQKMLAIVTPFGSFRPQFLPEGVQPASGILAHLVQMIFGDLSDICIAAQDNLLVGADTLDQLLINWKIVIERCILWNVILSAPKTQYALTEAPFFGYILGHGFFKINPERQAAIARIEFPATKKALHSFLGMCLFVSPFIENYSEKSAKLNDLLHKDIEWKADFDSEFRYEFENLKEAVAKAVEVGLPDMDADWTLRVDASDIACGGVLLQKIKYKGEWQMQPIAFVSHKFSKEAARWSVLEKELFGLVYALQRLDYYVRLKHIVAETDHSNILFLQQSLIPKLIRWKLFVQSYYLTIRHIPGKTNVLADALSRLYSMPARQTDEAQIAILNALGHAYAQQACTDYAANYDINEADVLYSDDKEELPRNICPLIEVPANNADDADAVPEPVDFERLEAAWRECHVRARGHRGARRTYLQFAKNYPEVPIAFDWIQARVDDCGICQKFKADIAVALRTARHILVADNHRSQISVDVCGMEEDDFGKKVCFVVTNHNTKLVFLYAAPGKGERETLNALLSFIGTYGIVDKVLSDEGGEFTGTFTQQLMEKLGINWNLTITERPQSHGTERSVGKVLDAVRTMLAEDDKHALNWSEPAVLATTAYLLNSETNDETGFSPFDLTFGKDEMTEFPDISGTPGKPALQLYMDALQRHLERVRADANEHRIKRQKQRQQANTPPGNHTYQPGDRVLVRRASLLLERKFDAKHEGPFLVVRQDDDDGAVQLRSLVDSSQTLRRHHNQLRIFAGTLEEATQSACQSQREQIILTIDDYSGSVYLRTATDWAVTWHDHSITWEHYSTVKDCQQLTDYATKKPYLKHRFSQSGTEFKAWATRVNRLAYNVLLEQTEGFFPLADSTLGHPFALAIQFFDANNELQQTEVIPGEGKVTVHMLQSAHWNSYLTAYLVHHSQTRYDIFVPSLSSAKTFKRFPAKGAYYRSLSASEILQFARPLPTEKRRSDHCADEIIHRTDFPVRVWPEQWDYAKAAQARTKVPVATIEANDQDEIDEGLTPGPHTGKLASYKSRGRTYAIKVEERFPNGDYLCLFDDNTDARVPLSRIYFPKTELLKRGGKGSDVH